MFSASFHAVTGDAGSSKTLMPVARRPSTRARLWRLSSQLALAPRTSSGRSRPASRLPWLVPHSPISLLSWRSGSCPCNRSGGGCRRLLRAHCWCGLCFGVAVDYFVEDVSATRRIGLAVWGPSTSTAELHAVARSNLLMTYG